MTIINFQHPKDKFKINARRNIILPGIPYTLHGNLEDSEFKELYNNMLKEGKLIRKPEIEHSDRPRLSLTLRINTATVEFKDGICDVWIFHNNIMVVYRNHEEWKEYLDYEKKEEIKRTRIRKMEEQKQHERTENIHKQIALMRNIREMVKNKQLELAEKTLFENIAYFEQQGNGMPREWQISMLISIFAAYDNQEKILNYLDEINASPENFIAASKYYYSDPEKAEIIFRNSLIKYPDEAVLYKYICMYYEKIKSFQQAIEYCTLACGKKLHDGTKTGFTGRLMRLKARQK